MRHHSPPPPPLIASHACPASPLPCSPALPPPSAGLALLCSSHLVCTPPHSVRLRSPLFCLPLTSSIGTTTEGNFAISKSGRPFLSTDAEGNLYARTDNFVSGGITSEKNILVGDVAQVRFGATTITHSPPHTACLGPLLELLTHVAHSSIRSRTCVGPTPPVRATPNTHLFTQPQTPLCSFTSPLPRRFASHLAHPHPPLHRIPLPNHSGR